MAAIYKYSLVIEDFNAHHHAWGTLKSTVKKMLSSGPATPTS